MLPVHLPVIIPCPFRGLKDPRCPLDPSGDRHGMDNQQPWPLARWFVDPRPIFFKVPRKLPCMVLVHAGRIAGHFWPLQAAIGVAVGSLLTQGASSCADNILSFFQSGPSLPSARRKTPSLQRSPQRHGRDIGMLGLEERLPEFPHTDTLASDMLGPYLLPNAGLAIHGSTLRRFPTRVCRLGLKGGLMVTRRGPTALDRAFAHIQALGCAQCGIAGRYFLMVLPLLIKMAFEVHDQLFHGGRKIFPLKRHRANLTVGVEHGCGCR
jgi:hypothetical protein